MSPQPVSEETMLSNLERAARFNEAEEENAIAQGRFITRFVAVDQKTGQTYVTPVRINPIEQRWARQQRRNAD